MNSPQIIQTGVFSLIWESGLVVKLVLLLLSMASVFCWAIIFTKWRSLKKATEENQSFLDLFWHSKSIDDILARSDEFLRSPIAAIFKSGVKELRKVSGAKTSSLDEAGVQNISRALMRASTAEIAGLEKHVGWLASTASAAPFVGLFGTVWGIMNSFQNIGATGAANLAIVAPGISEALIATATGLAAAIPAVIAYNHFAGQIKRLAVDMDCFNQDFLNIVQRSTLNGPKGDL
jgi:biopolymer transport protein TolQ